MRETGLVKRLRVKTTTAGRRKAVPAIQGCDHFGAGRITPREAGAVAFSFAKLKSAISLDNRVFGDHRVLPVKRPKPRAWAVLVGGYFLTFGAALGAAGSVANASGFATNPRPATRRIQ